MTNCLFDVAKHKLDCYKDKDCMERFCKDLREHAMKITDYQKKKNLADEETELYEMQKVCYVCRKIFSTDKND